MSRRWVFGLLAVAVVAALVIAELATSGSGDNSREAPPLPTQVLHGPSVDLASLHGSPALVNFWASWCTPCKEEAPTLDRLSNGLRGQARVVGVDLNDTTSNATEFIRDHGLSYPILRDGSGSVATHYRVSGLPTTFVLDSQGQIVRTLRGPQTASSLHEALRSVSSSD
ncbi:MAG TPA: TlpA disulfide reductase family protein [Solirubrobacterales bacterium]|jgi:DsbE subfamily thiol:disulfide oxidoreductase